MRIDLLLKDLCLVKTRSQARKGCESGCVTLNGKRAKPAAEAHAGDLVEIRYPRKILAVEILEVPRAQTPRGQSASYYRVIREDAVEGDGDWDD